MGDLERSEAMDKFVKEAARLMPGLEKQLEEAAQQQAKEKANGMT